MSTSLPNTGISVPLVRKTLGVSHNAVGDLCVSPAVNEWSPYKPISSGAITLSEAFREQVSGFIPISKYLSYNKPTGGPLSIYRLDDFRGYKHSARRPSNTIITANTMATYEGDTQGPSNALISISVTLPETDTLKKVINEYQVLYCSIYDEDDRYIGNQRMALTAISETNYILFGSVTLDLSTIPVGGSFSRNLKIYYGNDTDYKMFQIYGGDSISISGVVLANGVRIETRISNPTDSFVPQGISQPVEHTSTFDNGTGTFTMTYLKITGPGKNAGQMGLPDWETKNSIMYNNFANKVNWELRYTVLDGNNNIKVSPTVVPNWANFNIYVNIPQNASAPGSFEIVTGSTLTLTGMAHGDKVVFDLYSYAHNWTI